MAGVRATLCAALLVVLLGGATCASSRSVSGPRPSCQAHAVAYFPGEDQNPVWSPDGSQVLFSREWAGAECLAVVSAEGGRVRALAGRPLGCACSPFGDFAWSPGGAQIAYAGERPTRRNPKQVGIAFVRPDGSRVSWIEASAAMNLRWAPDGSRLAWTEGLTHLYFASADGSGVRTVAAAARESVAALPCR
jgi:Tol biopolymer transport system component